MVRSRIGWALSVAAPWCVAFVVLLSITAEAEQEPLDPGLAFAKNSSIEQDSSLDSGIARARPLQAVDAGGAPLPIVAARYAPNIPADLATGSDASEPEEARGAEFDPRHTMSPQQPSDDADPAPSSGGLSFGDGATPGPPLEFALNSSSPTSSDGVLVVVETDPAGLTTVPQLAAGGEPNYAALIDPKDSARQMRCLAEAIYFESRSEPEEGQAAVAQVVLNRVRSGIYPTTVCGVVYQDRNRPFACQFTFACEGKSLRIEEPGPWATATRIAQEVVSGANFNPKVGEAVNYHANYVSPFWVGYLRRVDRIGAHIFYAMREGVNWAPGALNGRGDLPPTSLSN
jgi:hypothetical protein